MFGGISLLAFYFPSQILYAVWFGFFLSLAGHFVIHIGHTIYIRKYIPSFITSLISLPISVIVLYKAALLMSFDVVTIVGIAISVLVMLGNFFLLHAIVHRINARINDPVKSYNEVPIPGRK